MKAKTPILFHGRPITGRTPTFKPELRQANREGRKTETRRIIPKLDGSPAIVAYEEGYSLYGHDPIPFDELGTLCPHGQSGDIRVMPEPLTELHGYALYADDKEPVISLITGLPLRWRWRTKLLTSQFMPVEAGRLVVEYNDIRAERLHDITAESAIAEGIAPISGTNGKPGWKNYADPHGAYYDPISSYRSLWESINAKRGFPWSANSWVWVISYQEVKP